MQPLRCLIFLFPVLSSTQEAWTRIIALFLLAAALVYFSPKSAEALQYEDPKCKPENIGDRLNEAKYVFIGEFISYTGDETVDFENAKKEDSAYTSGKYQIHYVWKGNLKRSDTVTLKTAQKILHKLKNISAVMPGAVYPKPHELFLILAKDSDNVSEGRLQESGCLSQLRLKDLSITNGFISTVNDFFMQRR